MATIITLQLINCILFTLKKQLRKPKTINNKTNTYSYSKCCTQTPNTHTHTKETQLRQFPWMCSHESQFSVNCAHKILILFITKQENCASKQAACSANSTLAAAFSCYLVNHNFSSSKFSNLQKLVNFVILIFHLVACKVAVTKIPSVFETQIFWRPMISITLEHCM